ncbi:MAG: hypothetical protein EZS28_025991 [Streblomastix strix]|uniref:Uncharacterized protein n=1 Tax=Streblomastix strix TaxID=222440 RepID=A0A5J4V7M9_9EUKA|nr:MAG: hypothetical protein EZS28_025991 [Streblomastix strix]
MPSLTEVSAYLQYFKQQILYNSTRKLVIRIPKLLQSLVALSLYRLNSRLNEVIDRQELEVRHWSRYCLNWIQRFGDAQVQSELVNIGYGRMIFISFCTAGGKGEEQNKEINVGLNNISHFLRELHEGRNYRKPSFQPLPLLARMSLEQIEEEGANEELEAQMCNNVYDGDIKSRANDVKATILNRFSHRG